MDKYIAQDISRVAINARREANYLRLIPADDYQQQTASQALEKVAKEIETLVAKYYIYAGLFADETMMKAISYDCRKAIKQEIHRSQTWNEFAELR